MGLPLRELLDWVPEIGELAKQTRARASGHGDAAEFYRSLMRASAWQGAAASEAAASMLTSVLAHDVRAEQLSTAANNMDRAHEDADKLATIIKNIVADAVLNPAVDVNLNTNQGQRSAEL